MNRLSQISLSNFRCFRDAIPINTDADIVLVTGKNGSGKTTLLQAITLILNGYDLKLFGGVDFVNHYVAEKVASINIAGIKLDAGDSIKPRSDKDWRDWESPFTTSRSNLEPSLARVATAYFQDRVEELANGDFLKYLTGAGNQGSLVLDWVKKNRNEWKGFADDALPEEKNWEDERKRIVQQIDGIQRGLLDNDLQRLFQEFDPLLQSGNLAKHWQTQFVNLAKKFDVKAELYSPELLDIFGQKLRERISEEKKQRASQTVAGKKEHELDLKRLRDLSLIYGDHIEVIPEERQLELAREIEIWKEELVRLRQEQAAIKQCEPKTSAVRDILDTVSDNIENALAELETINEQEYPLPEDLKQFLLYLKKTDIEALGTSYNNWQNQISVELEKYAQKVSELSGRIEKQTAFLEILKLLFHNEQTRQRLKISEVFSLKEYVNSQVHSTVSPKSTEHGYTSYQTLMQLAQYIQELMRLEEEYEEHARKKSRMASFQEAKKYAKTWSNAYEKESKTSGIFFKIMNKLDLTDVQKHLGKLLSVFHLPEEFVSGVTLRPKGTGKKAILAPFLDKVDFGNLSTGQKTLFALAWTTVLNASFRQQLGHNVMLFDDITTSLDLNQITPACILFRKLAYSPDSTKQRQLFVSSHHEDLTNRLIDNLIPPMGRQMRIIEIENYTIEKGPQVSSWEVAPSKGG